MPSGRVRIPAKWLRSLLKLPKGTTVTAMTVLTSPLRLEVTVSHADIVDPTNAVPVLQPDFTPSSFLDWGQ